MKFMRLKSMRVFKGYLKSDGRCVQRIQLFLRLFQLCGVFANEIAEGRLKRCSFALYCICVFWISFYVAFACCLFYYFQRIESINARLTIDVVKHLMAYINLSINIVITYTSQNRFIQFFDRLENYDDEVARMKSGRRDSLLITWIITFSVTVLNLFLVSVMAFEKSTGVSYFVILSEVCALIMHMYGTVEKFLMCNLMLQRFKHLNERIVPRVSWDEKWSNVIKIQNVKTLYSMLFDAHDVFNSIYNNSMLIWFAVLMLEVVANIRIFREKSPLIATAFVVPQILQILILCATCHYTAEQANKIADALNENMCTLISSQETMAKIGVLIYFLHNRVSFDAAGFFTINLSLFQSIVAAITTYFILLI